MDTPPAIDRSLASPALSEATRRAYRVDLEQFASWLEAHTTSVNAVDAGGLAAYTAELGSARAGRNPRRLAPATIARKLAAPRALLGLTLRRARGPAARPAPPPPAATAKAAPEATQGRQDRRRADRPRLRRPASDQKPRPRGARLL